MILMVISELSEAYSHVLTLMGIFLLCSLEHMEDSAKKVYGK